MAPYLVLQRDRGEHAPFGSVPFYVPEWQVTRGIVDLHALASRVIAEDDRVIGYAVVSDDHSESERFTRDGTPIPGDVIPGDTSPDATA
ncbi:hypothetical protein Ga0074812_101108 [Parafrankia irregularis]|uniref:Uncharacterized protein n=1 Tax=Parafrankia irregularis TaxID=795642 RepID=A0A0S4QG80_9ACTN|nr:MULTISPECIES: hypothetical protein [Parafrankia]MBE3199718.1 hypothetical protein [Parafrankia sp. CH37]CUU53610.1 hypothetical protein Ga0074812_101108 [Parafrankia irregularis]